MKGEEIILKSNFDKLKEDLDYKLNKMGQVMGKQAEEGVWDTNPYMCGMFNGMEVMVAIIENRHPNFRNLPDKKPDKFKEKIMKPLTEAE